MKKLSIMLGVLAIAGMLCGCDSKKSSGGSSVVQEVSDTIDYGIGVTQTRALKKAQQQVQQLNDQHNKELEDALK
ncbi:MAG: hypothetical protein J5654_02785 [Victivallales bacterium]|nr:hypothetical protein [Victivallales bacterium]